MAVDKPRERGYEWSKRSKEIRERDNHTCRRCFGNNFSSDGNYTCLVTHHIIPGRKLPVDDARIDINLVTVCSSCHAKLEKQGVKAQFVNIGRIAEVAILDKLGHGRGTPGYIAEEIGKSKPYVRDRLKDLKRLGHVQKVHRGLYELADAED